MSNFKHLVVITLLLQLMSSPVFAAKIIRATPPSPPAVSASSAASGTSATLTNPATAPTPITIAQTAPPAPPTRSNATTTAAPTRAITAPATTAIKTTGMYFGAQLGDSEIGALLGYQFTRMFGMEISYDYADPVYTTTTRFDRNRLGASALAMFPLKFNEMGPMALYVKVGYARTTEILTSNDPGIPPSIPASSFINTTTRTSVTGGAGVHVDLSSSASARLGVNVVGSNRTTYLAAMYKF